MNEEDLGPVVRVGESSTEMVLDWSLYSGGASDVFVRHQQGLDMGGTFEGSTVVALVSAPTESFAAEVLAGGEDHEYRVFALSREDELFFYRTDHLGTPIAMTNAQQNLVWRAEHRPFGDLGSLSMSEENDLRFPGQYFDVETGLHQSYFRDYDPGIGRYQEPDPIGGASGEGNLYAYARNSPVVWSDRLGLSTLGDVGYRIDPRTGSADVVFVWSDPTPDQDWNGDEVILLFGNSFRCPDTCSERAQRAPIDSLQDPYRGFTVIRQWKPSQRLDLETYEKRWHQWKTELGDPVWSSYSNGTLFQCYSLVNHMTGFRQTTGVWPFLDDRDLDWWYEQTTPLP